MQGCQPAGKFVQYDILRLLTGAYFFAPKNKTPPIKAGQRAQISGSQKLKNNQKNKTHSNTSVFKCVLFFYL